MIRNEWTIHTPDMGGELPIGTHLIYAGRRWCDIHKMYEFVFTAIDNDEEETS